MTPIIISAINFAFFNQQVKIETDLQEAAGYSIEVVITAETVKDTSGKFPLFTAVIHRKKGWKYYRLQLVRLFKIKTDPD